MAEGSTADTCAVCGKRAKVHPATFGSGSSLRRVVICTQCWGKPTDTRCRECGCTLVARCDDGGRPCTRVERDLCSRCMRELKTDPNAAEDFWDWIEREGPRIETSLAELERCNAQVAKAAEDLDRAADELRRTMRRRVGNDES